MKNILISYHLVLGTSTGCDLIGHSKKRFLRIQLSAMFSFQQHEETSQECKTVLTSQSLVAVILSFYLDMIELSEQLFKTNYFLMFGSAILRQICVNIVNMYILHCIIGERWEAIWIHDHVYACVLKVYLQRCVENMQRKYSKIIYKDNRLK